MVCNAKWPEANENFILEDSINLVIQINGKKKYLETVPKGLDKKETEEKVLNSDRIKVFLKDKRIKKVIVVPEKILNIVI